MKYPTVAFLLSTSATMVHASVYPDPIYLSKTQIALDQILAPPPARGSIQDIQDFETIFQFQTIRSAEECKRAAFVVDVKLNTLFGPAYGPLSNEEVAKWENFFEKIRIDTDYFVQEAKKQWGRPRPYFADFRVAPCVKREITNAYPSGHAAISFVFAKVLERIAPDRGQFFFARAIQIGQDRVLAGVHHPTDIESGQKLGAVIYGQLINNPKFVRDLEALRRRSHSKTAFVWGSY